MRALFLYGFQGIKQSLLVALHPICSDVHKYVIGIGSEAVSYTHLRAHETVLDLVCRLLLVGDEVAGALSELLESGETKSSHENELRA